jgi:Transmembrane secretion effector
VLRRLLIDLGPLRASSDFRRLFYAQTVSMVGSQLTVVAIAFQVYSLTGSSLQVGAVSLAQLVPFVVGTVAGGALADALDRRLILVVASALLAACSSGLALNALAGGHASVVAVYLLTSLAAGLSGVVSTATTAAVPSFVTAAHLTASYATMQVIDQVGMVAGPAAAGALIAAIGLPGLYGIDSLTFLWAAAFLWCMAPSGVGAAPGGPGLRSALDGLHYLRGRQVLQGAYLVDLCATVFGLPRAVFPALAHTVFHGGAVTLGFLYATPAAGALAGSLTSGWLRTVSRAGRGVLIAVAGWGVTITAFGFARELWIGLALLFIAGWLDVVSAVLRSTIVQTVVSERYRSRISGLQMAVVEGGPRLGDLESGAVASAVSPQFSVVSGGILCLFGTAVLMAALPGFRSYRLDRGDGIRP